MSVRTEALLAMCLLGVLTLVTLGLSWQMHSYVTILLFALLVCYALLRSYTLYGRIEAERLHALREKFHAEELAELNAKAMELVSAAEMAKAAAENARTQLDALFQSSPLAIITLAASGNVTGWNPTAEHMFGWTAAEVLGAPLPFFRKHGGEVLTRIVERASAGDRVSGLEIAQTRKDGSAFEAQFWSAPLHSSPDLVCGTVITVADVSENKRLESQLRVSQKMEAVGRLAGGIAHDFNNLLTVINGYSAMLAESIEDPYSRTQAEDVLKAGTRAAALVAQLLSFSRHQVMKPQPVDLNQLVTDIERMLRRLIGEHIQLQTALDNRSCWILADCHQIETVLINLATNARDAMPDGGTLTMETVRVDVRPDARRPEAGLPPAAYVRLTVRDTGLGMDASTQQHLFEPFFTTKRAGKGTGLGLSSVYGIVQKFGGRIHVRSAVGSGTSFFIYLPRCEPAVAESEAKPAPAVERRGHERILLVEDENSVRQIAREILSRAGYRVCESENGAAAIVQWGAQLRDFDLLVTDVVMPLMDGVKLAEEARRRHPKLKIIFMSGHAQEMLSERNLRSDRLSDFLSKPFHPDMLTHKVRAILDRGATGAAAV
jgi:two-component system, cell cycle sensor histidine kinase and response regulator CckA